MAIRLVVLLGVLGIAGSDPVSLVRRLGAPKYAEREIASAEIEKLGREALPALKAAKTASDAEIRSRAMDLVDRIENDLMVKPTLISLNFQGTTLSQALAKLSEKGQVNLTVPASFKSRTIQVLRDEPVAFWQALELIGRAGGVELGGGATGLGYYQPQRVPTMALIPSLPNAQPTPVSISGPFRVTLVGLNRHKEIDFTGGAGIGIQPMQARNFMNDPRVGRGGSVEQFTAQLQVMAEPRMTVAPNGPVRLIEAVDELGNSLLTASPPPNAFVQNSGYSGFEAQGGMAFPLSLSLRYPIDGGKLIRRLRGVMPVTVTSRKDEPLVIPLADSKGKTFQNAEASLTLHEVKIDPVSRQTIIELTILPKQAFDPNNGFGGNFMMRGQGLAQGPLEILDAQGRVFPQWYPSTQMQSPEGVRMSIRLTTGLLSGPATQLRYYETSRANTNAEFEFIDVPMP